MEAEAFRSMHRVAAFGPLSVAAAGQYAVQLSRQRGAGRIVISVHLMSHPAVGAPCRVWNGVQARTHNNNCHHNQPTTVTYLVSCSGWLTSLVNQ